MTTTAVPATSLVSPKSHIGLVVLGAIASGVVLGLVLVLVVLAGGPENEITGAALLALGSGFVLLAVGSRRFSDQAQRWALVPGLSSAVVGLAVWALSPGDHTLALAGWAWPAALVVLVGWSFRGARRELHSWSRTAVLYPALFVLLLIAAGGAFETVAEATSSNPPLGGRTYLVNGRHLYLHCVGAGSPTVVLFNGLGERTPNWAWVQQAVSSSTRVCTFDRAGEGWSGGEPGAPNGGRLSSDAHRLLAAAHIPGPYVLAGHSVGGIYALLYAAHYPEQVAGVALIDSTTPYQFDLPDYPRFYTLWRRGSALLPSLARVGLTRLFPGGTLPSNERAAARAFASSARELRANRVDFAQLPRLLDEAKALRTLGNRPLGVVSGAVGEQRGWASAQQALAKLSTNSEQRTVVGASHDALLADRGFASVTSRAIVQVVRAARAGQR